MSDRPIIEVAGLGKRYHLGPGRSPERYTALRDVLMHKARSLFQRRTSKADAAVSNDPQEFWALKDVGFSVRRGEVVGIVGRNGAGKSTLLKILSRITEPTEGRVTLRGRVASLLEVGTGFHPELTGRENIFLNGAILGMSRAEIKKSFDEIVAFAEVERFLDTPVKRYSSGMYVRLAFAVAAHLEPEILIVDEVLAVGDAEFQKKCLGKMKSVAASGGRTVLFVSHNMGAVRGLCDRGILLAAGSVRMIGKAGEVVAAYGASAKPTAAVADLSSRRRAGSGEVQITGVSFTSQEGEPQAGCLIGEPLAVHLDYRVRQPATGTFFLLLTNREGVIVFSSFQRDNHPPMKLDEDGAVDVLLDGMELAPGFYGVSAGIFDLRSGFIEWVEEVADFEVLGGFYDGRTFDHRLGVFTRQLTWSPAVRAVAAGVEVEAEP